MNQNTSPSQGWLGVASQPPLTPKKPIKGIKNNNDPAHVRVGTQIYLHRGGQPATPSHPNPLTPHWWCQ